MFETAIKIKQQGNLILTRNEKSINPLFAYNGLGLTMVNNNVFVEFGSNMPFKIISIDALIINNKTYLEYNYEINLDNSVLTGEQF